NNVLIDGVYGDSFECIITAKYNDEIRNDKDGTGFTYSLGSVNSEMGEALLTQYGLTGVQMVSTSSVATGYKISGTFSDVTGEGGAIVIPLIVTDNKAADDLKTTTYYITINIDKRSVTLNPATVMSNSDTSLAPYKTYDGSDKIGVSTSADVYADASERSGKLAGDDVSVLIASPQATLDSADAGEGKNITLNNVSLTGADASKYKLVGADEYGNIAVIGVAKVSKAPISITIERTDGLDTPVLYGQDTPAYRIKITDSTALAGGVDTLDEGRYNALSSDSEREAFMRDVLGFQKWNTGRKIYSPAGTYTIYPTFENSNSNYTIEATGATAEFSVVVDVADKDIDYKYSSDKGTNGFYPGLTITPMGDYDGIRRLPDSNNDITEDMDRTSVIAKFSNSLKLENMINTPIYFQLMDYTSGAVTTVVLDTVSVDNTKPAYVTHTISPAKEYFNNLGFGSYYHKQDGIESVQITFEYEAAYSDCDLLHYYFVDESGNIKGNIDNTTKMTSKFGTNTYTGTISIGTAESGQLVVYATNSTGSESDRKLIKFESADNFTGSNAYYEWMVENNPITNASIVVSDVNGAAITDDSLWYNALHYELPATDDQSGVWKVQWIISRRNADGTVYTLPMVEQDAVKKQGAAMTEYGKITSYTFTYDIAGEDFEVGDYTVSAILFDNAKNETQITPVGAFKVDSKAPVITDETAMVSGAYKPQVNLEFTVVESENESQIENVKLYKMAENSTDNDVLLTAWGDEKVDLYSYTVMSNGVYKVVATDYAGNESSIEITVGKISAVIPEIPIITVSGTTGNDGWYIGEMPVVHISASTATSDGVPVDSEYMITYEHSTNLTGVIPKAQAADFKPSLTGEGKIVISAWSTSESGVKSEVATKTIYVDSNAPVIEITESETDADGNLVINYMITDDESGVATDSVVINGKPALVIEKDGVVNGSFVAQDGQEYVIGASDIAGNEAEDATFRPLSLIATPIMNITAAGASIEADVYEGTYPIDNCYIAYKKHGDSVYSSAMFTKTNETYGIHMSCDFRRLAADTVYDYKIYAITETSREIKVIEGSFKTTNTANMANIKGNVTYSPDIPSDYTQYPVYVTLYEADTALAGAMLSDSASNTYTFNNLPNGTYRIIATDGILTKTQKVVIYNGGVSYPENYIENDGINFVLDGLNTSIVVDDNVVNVVVDGLDLIYESSLSGLYEEIITREDKRVLAEGGTIDVVLHAGYISEESVSEIEKDTIRNGIDDEATIERYIQLYVVKEVKDKTGKTVIGPELISELYDDITVSIPLGNLADKDIHVASAHEEINGEYSFKN
ncbi:MAG: YDG domain-containing protein, partial [Wujia sp.]